MKSKKSVRGKIGVERGFGPQHMANSKEGEPVDLTKIDTDTVDAKLTPREAVLNRNASELAGRDNIEKLNAEGNQLAKKGVDLAAKGDDDVANLNGKQLWDAIMTALQGRQAPAEKLGPMVNPEIMAAKGDNDVDITRRKNITDDEFQSAADTGGDPTMSRLLGPLFDDFIAHLKDQQRFGEVPWPASSPEEYNRYLSNKTPMEGVVVHQKGTGNVKMKSKLKQSKPASSGSPYVQAFQKLMPKGGAPVGYQGGGGNVMPQQGQPAPMPFAPPNPIVPPPQNPLYNSIGGGPRGYADGTGSVGPIGTPPQGEQAYGPPVQLSAPQIQQLAKQTGISPAQLMGLMKAFQGGQGMYNSIGGGGMNDSGGYGTAPPMGAQGGISDIGYPPFVAPGADYDGHRGGWLGPYDPSFMIQRYAGGISSVPFR